MPARTLYRLLWIPSLLAIVGMTFVFATQPLALPIPAPMKRYTTGDKSLRIEHPGNWPAHATSSHGLETEVEFKPGQNARMTVSADLTGSLTADLMKSTDASLSSLPGMEGPVTDRKKTPLEQLHDLQAAQLEKEKAEYPGFQDGEMKKVQVAGKEALITDFTCEAPGLLGSRPMVGRRVTLLSGDHHVAVVYVCLKEMRNIVLPVFDKMLSTLEVDPQTGGR